EAPLGVVAEALLALAPRRPFHDAPAPVRRAAEPYPGRVLDRQLGGRAVQAEPPPLRALDGGDPALAVALEPPRGGQRRRQTDEVVALVVGQRVAVAERVGDGLDEAALAALRLGEPRLVVYLEDRARLRV